MTKDWEEALNAGYVHTPAVSVIYGYMYNADLNINHGRADKPSLRAYNCFNRVFQDILSKQDKNGYVPIDVADSAVHVLNSYIDNEYRNHINQLFRTCPSSIRSPSLTKTDAPAIQALCIYLLGLSLNSSK